MELTILISVIAVITAIIVCAATIALGNYYNKKTVSAEGEGITDKYSHLLIAEIMPDGTILSVNDKFIEVTGYTEKEIINRSFRDFFPKDYYDDYNSNFEGLVRNQEITDVNIPLVVCGGEPVHVLWRAGSKSEAVELIGVNITRVINFNKEAYNLVNYDQLTELYNRSYFERHVKECIEQGVKIAILYFDFDNFKNINDTYSHAVGDEFLMQFVKRMEVLNFDKTKFCRIGGDEIAIIYKDPLDYGEVGDYGNYVLNLAYEEYNVDGIKINITCSMGISFYPDDGNTFNELFKAADIAMNKAKEMGKSRIVFFNTKMRTDILEAAQLEKDLIQAINNDEFILYYQPQYSFKTGKLYGFEALLRWVSPTRGFVSPGVFIPASEKALLIVPMGRIILRKAAQFAKKISETGHAEIVVSANVSATQVLDDNFVGDVLDILESVGVNFANIKLELTESVAMESIDSNLCKLRELNSKGVEFALDDFGTGYSSLTYLQQMPIKVLKIDKSFVDRILEESAARGIIPTIIKLAHDLNLLTVAEGVEHESQFSWLRQEGCDLCQGYYSGKPIPEAEALECINKNVLELT
jgi:diguanylate cyclase (GGDEF)-like protein/PAS domain S-box-containing protein